MKSLLLLDWYTLWKQLKLFLFFILFYAVISLVSQSYMFLGFSVLFLCMLPYYLVQMNDSGRMDAVFLLMPNSRSSIVKERYITALISALLSLPLMLPTWLVMGIDALFMLVFQLAAGLLVLALLLPLAFKFGATKSRLFTLLMLALFFGSSGMVTGLLDEDVSVLSLGSWFQTLTWLAVPASLVLLGVSYLVSLRVYDKREF